MSPFQESVFPIDDFQLKPATTTPAARSAARTARRWDRTTDPIFRHVTINPQRGAAQLWTIPARMGETSRRREVTAGG